MVNLQKRKGACHNGGFLFELDDIVVKGKQGMMMPLNPGWSWYGEEEIMCSTIT
jgi:hypothetical protein